VWNLKYFGVCIPFKESQHSIRPQVKHRRRATQSVCSFSYSSQPDMTGMMFEGPIREKITICLLSMK
jgi:hypothetical protein